MPGKIFKALARAWRVTDQVARDRATGAVEYEAEERENIFSILVLGIFIGIPAPPVQVTLELLPYMEHELQIMTKKITTAHDPLADLFSVLDID
ncbi:MAG: hypothetical protein DRH32_04075 [Deltaproteobacteria bacterium]|nr:MAG: hypothetical protein DRH32_04075 [Deltaproteobacteria bacterium]